ncbi:MAG: LacI family transcriptional regulator [Chloroflexota bacterium]|nr:MAG: LacI family transcriptional regulator [Chloroflexota bacterium]
MSTIGDVAKRAGVSAMTVSRVINNSGYISQETRERVEQAIAELGYVPNALARSLRFKRTKTIALILTDITNPFFTTLARGIEDAASEQGFSVIFCNTDESQDEEAEYLSVVVQKQVDGVLLVPASSSSESVTFLRDRGVPCVLLDRRLPGAAVDTVRGDSEAGAYQLTRHLLDLGHRRIALLNGPSSVSTAEDRLAGYRRALDEAGLSSAASVYEGSYTVEGGYRTAKKMLAAAPRPTAVFAANNFIAIGALRVLREAGLRVPDNLSLVAFDDLPTTMMIDPFFTVIGQPAYEMGQRATQLLLEHLAGQSPAEPQEIVLPAQLIVRRSSGPPPAEI